MLIRPANFESQVKLTLNPRNLEEGFFVEFNYKKRDGTSQLYDCIVLDVYPPGGYVWALKLDDMLKTDFRRVLERFDTKTTEIQGQTFKKLELPEKGKQSYQVIKRLKLDTYYRKFIMSEMSLVRIRPIDFDSLI
jgi:hypothetical protein